MIADKTKQKEKVTYYFSKHPWISMATMIFTGILILISIILIANQIQIPNDAPYRPLVTTTLGHILVLFFITPFWFKLPNGKTTLRQYVKDIRLSRIYPFIPLLLLGFTCSLILLLILSANSLIFRVTQGLPLTENFLYQMIDLKKDLPPASMSYIIAFPSIFEEVLWRGVLLALFLKYYSEKKSIIITALGFGLLHFINLLGDSNPDFVIRQVIFASSLGVFYGYMVLKTNSLMPAMLFHYLVNMFIGSFTWYFQRNAPAQTQIIYCAISIFLAVPILILWVKFFYKRYISPKLDSRPLVEGFKT